MVQQGQRCPCCFELNILLNNPRNQPYCHIPVCVNPRHHKADFILLSGEAVIVAAMGDCIDTDVEADENSAFMDVRDGPEGWLCPFITIHKSHVSF